MDLQLVRHVSDSAGIFSGLFDKDMTTLALVGEHAYKQEDGTWKPKLPNGTYVCERRRSPHFGYDLFQITNVPGCTFIEIHIGNDPQVDSIGCLLLGETIITSLNHGKMVTNSRKTFEEFMALMTGINEFNLIVTD